MFRLCIFSAALLLSNIAVAAPIEITDSHGKYRFEQPPQRFVSLNWALTEALVELGETPLGVADLAQFKTLAPKAEFKDDVVDLGPRLQPSLEKIKALKPEIIFIGYSQRSLLRPLSNIATVIYFKNFGKRYNNAAKADERFSELAKLFAKQDLAAEKLAHRDQRLAELKESLAQSQIPPLLIIAPSTGGSAAQFAQNSLPMAAANALGLEVIGADKTDNFGVQKIFDSELKDLSKQPHCLVQMYKLSQLTSAPESNSQCQLQLDYQLGFGSAMSLLYLAEALDRAINQQ